MSYEQLPEHASEIVRKAARWMWAQDNNQNRPVPRDYGYFASQFDYVYNLFQPFQDMPDPDSFRPAIDHMDEVLTRLSWGPGAKDDIRDPVGGMFYHANAELEKLNGAAPYIAKWEGKAAQTFYENFITPFPAIERNQFTIACVLRSALEAYRGIWVAARNDIDSIAENATVGLDNMDECGRNGWPVTFTVVACVLGGIAIPLEAPAAVAVSALGTIAWVQAAKPPAKKEVKYHGESPPAVLGQMQEAITKLTNDIQDAQRTICDALARTLGLVDQTRTAFVAPRPALADATAATIKSDDVMGYPH